MAPRGRTRRDVGCFGTAAATVGAARAPQLGRAWDTVRCQLHAKRL